MGAIWVPSMGNGADLDIVTAESGDVLNGKVIVDKDGNPLTGTLQDNSGTVKSATASLDTTNNRLQMEVPATAKYSTTSKLYALYSTIRNLIGLTAAKIVSGNNILGLDGTATSDATLSSAAQLRKGIIGYGKNGAKYTGSMTEKAAATYTPSTANQTIAASQYLTGAQTIKGDANLKAANIKKDVSIFGVTGNYEGFSYPDGTVYWLGKCGKLGFIQYAGSAYFSFLEEYFQSYMQSSNSNGSQRLINVKNFTKGSYTKCNITYRKYTGNIDSCKLWCYSSSYYVSVGITTSWQTASIGISGLTANTIDSLGIGWESSYTGTNGIQIQKIWFS